jgi:hypothetical protein
MMEADLIISTFGKYRDRHPEPYGAWRPQFPGSCLDTALFTGPAEAGATSSRM